MGTAAEDVSYMGPNSEVYVKLADAFVVVGDVRLPVHSSELGRQSGVLLTAMVAHKEQQCAGPVVLSAPFGDASLAGVRLYLQCCYQPREAAAFLEEAMAAGAGEAVREAWRLAHATETQAVSQAASDFVAGRLQQAGGLGGSLLPWLEVTEECHAGELLGRLVQRFAEALAAEGSGSSSGGGGGGGNDDGGDEGPVGPSAAEQFVETASSLRRETVVAILAAVQGIYTKRAEAAKRKHDSLVAELTTQMDQAQRSVRQRTAQLAVARQVLVLDERITKRTVEWVTDAFGWQYDVVQSPMVQVGWHRWRVQLSGESTEYLGLFLAVEILKGGSPVTARYSLELYNWANPAASIQYHGGPREWKKWGWDTYGWPQFALRSKVLDGQAGFLKEGRLKIVVKIELVDGEA